MHKQFWIVVVIILLLPILVNAHSNAPLPFDLIIQKNITIPWLTETIPESAKFTKLEVGGSCRHAGDKGIVGYGVNLYNDTIIRKSLSWLVPKRRGHSLITNLELTEANKIVYESGGCTLFYLSGNFEAIRHTTTIKINDTVKINEPPEPIGTFRSFGPAVTLRQGEKLQVLSSNPSVLVYVGRDDDYGQQVTDSADATIYACADLDANRQCDQAEAQAVNCAGDFYKLTCCDDTRITTQGCGLNEKNAFCGKNTNTVEIGAQQYNTFFAMPEEVGIIHVFDDCAQPLNVVFDELRIPRKCERTSTQGFLTIKGHQYYCDPAIPKFIECGGDNPHSATNSLTTGQNSTIQGKTNYCRDNAQFSTNLDYTTKKSCERAGFSWTGTRCCSEADDPNEYYVDFSTTNNTDTPGGCWNSTFVRSGNYVPDYANNTKEDKSIINYNGSFYGCEQTNQQLLALENTESHAPAPQPIITTTASTTTAQSYLTDITLTPEGAHNPGGPACPAGYETKGSLADCGGGSCFGNQLLCGKYSTTEQPIIDAILTPEGQHTGSPACPAGYETKGSLADCGGGPCSGNQILCVQKGPTFQKTLDAILTPEGTHNPGGPACPAGYETKGTLADCGGGSCSGNQKLCVKKETRPQPLVDLANKQLIDGGNCPAGQLVCGTKNSGSDSLDQIWCCPTQGFNAGTEQRVIDSQRGQDELCNTNEVVCGATNSPFNSAQLDMIHCCTTTDVTVSATKTVLDSAVDGGDAFCQTDEAVCGAQTHPNSDSVLHIAYCCKLT